MGLALHTMHTRYFDQSSYGYCFHAGLVANLSQCHDISLHSVAMSCCQSVHDMLLDACCTLRPSPYPGAGTVIHALACSCSVQLQPDTGYCSWLCLGWPSSLPSARSRALHPNRLVDDQNQTALLNFDEEVVLDA